jgi:hypothetical protein
VRRRLVLRHHARGTASHGGGLHDPGARGHQPELGIYNGQPAGGYNVYLRYIKRFITVVGGSNTTLRYSSLVDNVTVKLTTTGTALATPANTNTSSNVASMVSGFGGVNVAAAQSASGRRVGAGTVCGSVETAFSETIFDFGSPVMGKNYIGAAALPRARFRIPR